MQIQRLVHEIKVHQTLKNSEYIVQLFGYSIFEHHVLICMELMDMSLRDFYQDIHKRIGHFSEDLLGYITVKLVNGLDELHKRNMVHRDIKPTNILVNYTGEIKLCDFGEARKLEDDLALSTVGTICYWPPERVMPNDGYDARVDIWSLGITLTEIISGKLPYEKDGNQLNRLIDCIRKATAADIISSCFEHNPISRFNRVYDFIEICLRKYAERPLCDYLTRTNLYLRYCDEPKEIIFGRHLKTKPKLKSLQLQNGVEMEGKARDLVPFQLQGVTKKKAFDNKTSRLVIIRKLINPVHNAPISKRTYRAFQILSLVDHKNLVRLLDAYTPQTKLSEFKEIYLVVEHMDFPLRVLIHNRKTQFQNENGGKQMSFIIFQLLCGINHLHKLGLGHRHLTPDNIMINKNFHLKIVDVGITRKSINDHENSSLNDYFTHYYYCAPEVLMSTNYGYASDVWSAGMVFAELITGNILCAGRNDTDQYLKILDVVGTPEENYIAKLPPPVQQYLRMFPKKHPISFDKLFPDNLFPLTSSNFSAKNGRDLLSCMLVFDPDKRISIKEALEHPYLAWKLQNNSEENYNYSQILTDEHIDLTDDEWKKLIFEQIKKYEKNNGHENII